MPVKDTELYDLLGVQPEATEIEYVFAVCLYLDVH
jgi:curved DNA-binding protein CbpA